jgi:exosortase E/protease (VPEID-CTERM system)
LLAQQQHSAIYTFRSLPGGLSQNLPKPRAKGGRFRFVGLALLLALEVVLYHQFHVREDARNIAARWCVTFVLAFCVLGFPRLKSRLRTIFGSSDAVPVSRRYISFHFCALTIFLAAASNPAARIIPAEYRLLLAAAWLGAGIGSLLFAGLAYFPLDVWRYLFLATGPLWIYSAATASVAFALEPAMWRVWTSSPATFAVDVTFWLVAGILQPLVSVVYTDWGRHIIGTDRFTVEIAGSCSGWEGLGLVAIFTILSLWLSRRDYRFPAALILIPVAMVLTFALNSVRIAALILIGDRGFPGVAIGGFHSQAGWIAFSGVALGVSLVAPRIRWLQTARPESQPQAYPNLPNPVVPFVLPFAAILAAGMISLAATARFEWLYPLRVFAALAALWYCRRQYPPIRSWRPGWFPLFAGVIVFLVWIVFDRSVHSDNGIAAGLAGMPAAARISWLSLRTLAAIITVPIAEELAFRGFLLRRLVSSQFESVDFRRWSYMAVIASSLVFGALHRDRWIVATIAGLIYAVAMIRRGKIWDAIAAHAISNAMLAAWVLFGSKWYYW